jgi:succinate dehydrogenase/fumarate reductase iron-sulfur protein
MIIPVEGAMMGAQARILRFDPLADRQPYFKNYSFVLKPPGMRVLDVLNQIRETKEADLAYAACCRSGHCGQCALLVNGYPALSCRREAEPRMELRPLPGFTVLRDLLIDRREYEGVRSSLRLFLERKQKPATEPEYIDQSCWRDFKAASRCIECYCCLAACPLYRGPGQGFAGPAALVLEARHFFDPRDDLDRVLILRAAGLDMCLGCGRCSQVCAAGVDPAALLGKLQSLCFQGQ